MTMTKIIEIRNWIIIHRSNKQEFSHLLKETYKWLDNSHYLNNNKKNEKIQ